MISCTGAARIFLGVVWLLGLAATLAAFLPPHLPGDHLPPTEILLATALAAFAGARKVTLIRSARFAEAGSLSPAFVLTFAALLAFGLRAGVLVGLVSGVSAGLFPRRQPLRHSLFHLAALAGATWTSAQVFALLNHGLPEPTTLGSTLALLLATLVYFLCETGSSATIIALSSRQRTFLVWRQNFLWAAPAYFAGASCALVGRLLLISEANLLLLALPIVGFVYQTYQVYSENAERKQRTIEELQAGHHRQAELYLSTVQALATAMDARDQYVPTHGEQVERYAVATAEALGMEGVELEAVKAGALLRDIGKLGVPDYVLLKSGPLTAEEFEQVKRHPLVGAAILDPVQFPWPVASIVRHHHERWNGSGYPDGLTEDAIPLGARVLAVADVYDALCSDRPYRSAWDRERARDYIEAHAGTLFDPRVVAAFREALAKLETTGTEARNQSRADLPEQEISRHIGRTTSEQWALYEIMQTLNASLSLPERLEVLSRQIAAVRPGTTGAFLLHDPPPGVRPPLPPTIDEIVKTGPLRRKLWVWATGGVQSEALQGVRSVGARSLSARVAATGRLYRGACGEDDSLPNQTGLALRSALIVPLAAQGETFGTLNLYHTEADMFREEEERLVLQIVAQVQSALYQDRLLDRTRNDALTDSLTGFYNVRFLTETVGPLLSRGSDTSTPATAALLYLDLDRFKLVNDRFGHLTGNAVLRDITRLFHDVLRPGDMVVRYGGDEFVIVLRETNERSAQRVAARIRAAIVGYRSGLILPDGMELRLDASIGIACCPQDGDNINTLVAFADQRMYEEKQAHKRWDQRPATALLQTK